jgi:hypothetical protein
MLLGVSWGSVLKLTPKMHWILVTGAASNLSPEEVEVSQQVGAMLAREGYGLIIGDWDGVDWLVKAAFLEALPLEMQAARIKHVANNQWATRVRVPGAPVIQNDGPNPGYCLTAVSEADAGIIISGRKGSKPSMDALMRFQKPVLPVPFWGWDAFELYRDILAEWNERPVQGLTERQFLELMKPWHSNPQTLRRLLRASLTTEPEIFISYRRDDVPAAAGRIFDELSHAYGYRSVFIDYASLNYGDQLDRIITQLKRCRVLVALIGPDWNLQRLIAPEDFVRRELEAAKAAELKVIPLLVQRNALPTAAELPPELSFIEQLNAPILRMNEWASSIRQLQGVIDDAVF